MHQCSLEGVSLFRKVSVVVGGGGGVIVITIIIQALKLIGGGTPTLGKTNCLTQPTDTNVTIILQKHPE